MKNLYYFLYLNMGTINKKKTCAAFFKSVCDSVIEWQTSALFFSYKNWIVLIIVKIQLRSRNSESAN